MCAGNPVESFGLSKEDIQADFDPETYDETMKKVFNDDYYEEGEGEKPVFSDLEAEKEGKMFVCVCGGGGGSMLR
jgi:hypothetical protein